MGQPINVVSKPSPTPGIARFEANRSFTGMGHERYPSADAVVDDRPVDQLARRLFATGGVQWVHVNGSVVTVALAEGRQSPDELLDVIRGLYIHYPHNGGGSGETAATAADTPDGPSAGQAPEPVSTNRAGAG